MLVIRQRWNARWEARRHICRTAPTEILPTMRQSCLAGHGDSPFGRCSNPNPYVPRRHETQLSTCRFPQQGVLERPYRYAGILVFAWGALWWLGTGWAEGVGSGPDQTSAASSCCDFSGVIIGQAFAQSASGQWFCCTIYGN